MKSKLIICLLFAFISLSYSLERINGTKVSLDVPNGFTKAAQFPGYMKQDQGASIMVTEVPAPFSAVAQGFTQQGLASKGMTLLKIETSNLVTKGSLLIHVSQEAQGIKFLKWMFVFGNTKETIMVVATLPEQFKGELLAPLKKSVLSVTWDINAKIDFYEGLTFRVTEKEDLLISKKIGNQNI